MHVVVRGSRRRTGPKPDASNNLLTKQISGHDTTNAIRRSRMSDSRDRFIWGNAQTNRLAVGFQRHGPARLGLGRAGDCVHATARLWLQQGIRGDAAPGGSCTSGKPFFFSLDVPEGNYNVTVTLGDPSAESITTVKAEARRLVLERVKTPAGKTQSDRHRQRPQPPAQIGRDRPAQARRAGHPTGTTCLRSNSAMFTPACVPWK